MIVKECCTIYSEKVESLPPSVTDMREEFSSITDGVQSEEEVLSIANDPEI